MSTFIQKAYVTLFGRPADPAGLAYWEAASATFTEAEIYAQLIASPEFARTVPTREPADVLARVYVNAFGRAPDTEGLLFWLRGIDAAGDTPQALADAVATIVRGPIIGSPDEAVLSSKLKAADGLTTAMRELGHDQALTALQLQTGRQLLQSITPSTVAESTPPPLPGLPTGNLPTNPHELGTLEYFRQAIRDAGGDINLAAQRYIDALEGSFNQDNAAPPAATDDPFNGVTPTFVQTSETEGYVFVDLNGDGLLDTAGGSDLIVKVSLVGGGPFPGELGAAALGDLLQGA